MPTNIIKAGWLKDANGEKFAPKTLTSQVQTSDGTLLEEKIQNDISSAISKIPTPDVSGQINDHNINEEAHADIRKQIEDLGAIAAKDIIERTDLSKDVNTSLDKADTALQSIQKGTANGVAELDASGKVPSAQLPSYVDDVLEYSAKASFPATGETDKIYIDTTTNITYRWGGSTYVPIGSDLALGETSSTAYYGDKGKVAYEHSQVTSDNPHGLKYDDLLSKPFYSEYVITKTVLFPERTMQFEDGYFEDAPSPHAFTENTEYTITLDGVDYTSVSVHMTLGDDFIVFGNPGLLNGEDNGQPIMFIYRGIYNDFGIQILDNVTASHTVAVSQNTTTEEIHKLDPKYIHTPDVGGQINEHNTSEESHADIRNAISQKTQVQFITWEAND